jgi:hypothetical protein
MMSHIHTPIDLAAASKVRGRVRHALRLLSDALDGTDDATIRRRLFEAEEAAILAETRIAELENRLEALRRLSRANPIGAAFGARSFCGEMRS